MAFICEKPKGSCEHCIHYREDSDGRMCCYAEKDTNKYHNYKSPVSLELEYDRMGKIEKQIIDQSEKYIARAIMKVTNLEVDKDELVKALNYDRGQFDEGYRQGYEAREKEIVRCKDCEYYNAKENTAYVMCPVDEGIDNILPNDFCRWAKRRERQWKTNT